MISAVFSRHDFSRSMLVLALTTALVGCFDGNPGSQRQAVAATAVSDSTTIANNQAPEISGIPTSVTESGQTYNFVPTAKDADQDFLEFEVTNKPTWAEFSNETGVLSGTPQDSDVGETAEITIAVTDGRDHRAIGPFRISIAPRGQTSLVKNAAPLISGAPDGSARVGIAYNFVPVATDVDGNKLSFLISNRPSWVKFNTATGALTGTAALTNVGTYKNIVVSVTDGKATTSLPAFTIKVNNSDNRAPMIGGSPATSVQATQAYSFTPAASDSDGDTLSYSIENKPLWATFSATTGRLSGTPAAADVGNYSNIAITASDGKAATSLPAFAVVVQAASNGTPAIVGSPAMTAMVGSAYSFRPTGSDPNGDALGYSIQNRPTWATFDTTTGVLGGTPGAIGTSGNIIISVSDGKLSASLPAFEIVVGAAPLDATRTFSGTAALAWEAPTENIDGTALGNLAGFRVVYGTSASALTQTVEIANAEASSYTISSLSPGTWYFAVKAFNAAGMESALSTVASKTIN